MKKKNLIFIILYFVILAVPAVGMPFFLNAKNTENRKLSEFPKIIVDGKPNLDFVEGLDDFVNDRIGFRQYLVMMNTALKTGIFRQSTEDSIILGKDNWLFYSDTVDDYMGIQTLSDRNIQNIVNTYEMVNERLKDYGKTMVFTVIPNKNSVYPEYMADTYIYKDGGNLSALSDKMADADILFANVKDELLKNDAVFYQAQDSHWTYEGALIGYKTIMDASGFSYNGFDGVEFEERKDWDADLGVMLYSVNAETDVQKYPKYDFSFEYTSHEKEPDAIKLSTYNEFGTGNAVIYRDSFMNAGHVYFAENFENCLFSRAFPYKVDMAIDEEADLVVFEIVERNLKNLAGSAPLMEAGLAEEEDIENAEKLGKDAFNVFLSESGDYTHVFGTISKECLGMDNEIFIRIDNDYYKAFPIFERELLGCDETDDNGFSMYVPANDKIKTSDIELYVRRLE